MKLATQVFVSHTKPDPEKIDEVIDRRFWKPTGGLWTSTLDEGGGQWMRWLHGEGYSLDNERWGGKLWILQPKEANLFTVWSPREYGYLTQHFPHESNHGALEALEPIVDWVAVSKSYDGIHVPNPWTWRFGHDNLGAGLFFYGMDAECTCWFSWCFEEEVLDVPAWPYLDYLNAP